MSKKKPKFEEGDIIECQKDGEYGSLERYLIYGYSKEDELYVVLKAVDATKCGAGIDYCEVEPDAISMKYLEKFGKKIGFVDLSIFMDGVN